MTTIEQLINGATAATTNLKVLESGRADAIRSLERRPHLLSMATHPPASCGPKHEAESPIRLAGPGILSAIIGGRDSL